MDVQVNRDGVSRKGLGIIVLMWVNVKGNTRGRAMGTWSKGSGMDVGGLAGDAVELSGGRAEEVGSAGA